MRRLALLLLLSPLVAQSTAGAQAATVRVEGRVLIRGSTSPVSDAAVLIEGTAIGVRTDSLGRWTLLRVPPGPQTLLVRRIGYAPSRLPITVPATGTLTVDIQLATNALQLDQIIVTADRSGRARGELGTASVIDREAIASQISSSLQGVLELLPGVPLQPPGLDAAAQFSLRSLSQLEAGAASDIGASGTLIILDGVPLSNNANLQTVGVRGEILAPGSTAGGGIDLRRIPAAALERVEVIRGIPSVRWGDLTQGAIIVDTRATAMLPELAAKFDPRTAEANIVGGHSWSDEKQAFTATFNLAETKQARTLSSAATMRGAGQAAHRLQIGITPNNQRRADDSGPLARITLDTRLDWWKLRFDSPEREDVEVGRNSFQDDHGIRVAERARFALGSGQIEWTTSFDVQSQLTRESRRLGRPTTPFTDRIEEGRNIGTYIEGLYDGAYQMKGAPRLLYSRFEWQPAFTRDIGPVRAGQVRAGTELRREWNSGEGYSFDISRPPQASNFSGVNGFDRPRRFDDIPPLATSALYADLRLFAQRGEMTFEAQPGLRLDVLHSGGWWTSGAQSTAPQARFVVHVAPRPWVRVHAGAGGVSKVPTIGQLYPTRQYFDLVNVNRFTPDPAERLAVLTTFIRDPRNPDLAHSRGLKKETGIELDGGSKWGIINLTWFDDRINDAVTRRRDPLTLMRDRYTLVDTARGSGQPGRIVDPPIGQDPIPIFLDRNVNGGALTNRGLEYTITLPVVPALRTRLEVSGAKITSTFSTDDRDFGSILRTHEFQVDTTLKRIAYFEGRSNRAERGIRTWRLIHHQPDLGFVITTTVQQRLGDKRQVTGRVDSLSFVGYMTRTGELVPVAEADKLLPEYTDLRNARAGSTNRTSQQPDDWFMSIQVAKSIGSRGRLSFYAFNALDKLATFGGGTVRALPSSRFGAELTLPTSMLWGGGGGGR